MKIKLYTAAMAAALAVVPTLAYGPVASAQSTVPGLELVPPSVTPLFNSIDVIELRIEGKFDTLFKLAPTLPPKAGKESNDDSYAYVTGKLVYQDPNAGLMNIPIWIRVRGNTSKRDCTFPKLAAQFVDPNLEAEGKKPKPAVDLSQTIFAGAKSFKINTHCADEEGGTSGEFNRQRNQFSPMREALAYRIIETLGVPTLKTRPSRITYVFSDLGGQKLTRNAMLLETAGQFAKRMGGEESYPKNNVKYYNAMVEAQKEGRPLPPEFTDASEGANMVELALAYFANPIIGNHDWSVRTLGHQRATYPLWNILAMARRDGTRYIVPYDFDLASIVTKPENKYVGYIKEARGVFMDHGAVLDEVKSRLLKRRKAVSNLIERWDFSYRDIRTGETLKDEKARANMLKHMEAAFKEIEKL